jgi:hypothetical protein
MGRVGCRGMLFFSALAFINVDPRSVVGNRDGGTSIGDEITNSVLFVHLGLSIQKHFHRHLRRLFCNEMVIDLRFDI